MDQGKTYIQQFPANIEGKLAMVEELILNEDSSLKCAVFGMRKPFEVSSKKVKNESVGDGVEKIMAVRMYYNREGKKTAAIGTHITDFGTSFYAKAVNSVKPCFILFSKGEISTIDYVDGMVDEESEVLFNDNGKPEAYSYKDKDGKVIIKKL